MHKIIAFSNLKGGTGKTTSVINAAGVLADMGLKVLTVDVDQQASLTLGLKGQEFLKSLEESMYGVLLDYYPISHIITQAYDNIDLVPANINLAGIDMQLANEVRKEDLLKEALEEVKDDYDVIFIDCPPSLGLLTINALAASGGVVVPMSCDWYSLVGVTFLLDTVIKIRKRLNPQLDILGVLATRLDSRTIHSREVFELAQKELVRYAPVFQTPIRQSTIFQQASVAKEPITRFDPKHPGAQDYRDFVEELLHD